MEKGYLSAKDIMVRLGVSRTEANRILHRFEAAGKLYRFGPKVLRVKIRDFEQFEKGCRA